MAISRNPSFTPSRSLRADLNRENSPGVTARINQIYDRYEHLIKSEALRLTKDERFVLLSVLQGAVVDLPLITGLDLEIQDSEEYEQDVPGARSLLEKIQAAGYAQRLATVESIGL